MNSVLAPKVIFFVIAVGLADQETKFIKEIDHNYSSAKSISDLYKLEVLVNEFIETFPASDKIFWRLGRIYFGLGDKSKTESEKIRYLSLCMMATGKTLKINSQSAHGYFFKGLCNGTLGEIQGIWSSLGIIEPFKKDMEIAVSLDPSVEEGGPHRALGNLYLKLPYILGGDLHRSISHFKKATQLGSEFGENYLGLAEAYIENGEFTLAKDTLSAILAMKPRSQKEQSTRTWQTKARSFLKKIENK